MQTLARYAGLCVLLALMLGGCADAAPTSPGAEESSPAGRKSLTDEEVALAVDVAKQEVESEDATVTSATVTAEAGEESDTNTGYLCSSGRLLKIKLIGSFPHIVTTGHAVDPQSPSPPPDFTVHAVLLTADAASGRTCLIGVQTGAVEPEPGATVLALD